VFNVAEGREKARQVLYQLAQGLNPKAYTSKAEASDNQGHVGGIGLSEFFHNLYLPFVKGYKRSWKCDLTLIHNHIAPRFDQKAMQEISPVEIGKFIDALRQQGYAVGTCNRVLVLLRYGFSLAMKWQVPGIASNPAKELPNLKQDNRIERYLSPEEAIRLMQSVRVSENAMLQFIVPYLIYTGARKREVLDAKWQDIDWQEKSWRIPLTKSGKVRHVPLSEGAIDTLLKLKNINAQNSGNLKQATTDAWIFANPKTGKPYVSIFYSWDTARKLANLPYFRIHDLRHSFASFLVNAGRSLYEVQELLGHADIRTTSRYAHLNRERLVGAVACVPRV
jgi:integrase